MLVIAAPALWRWPRSFFEDGMVFVVEVIVDKPAAREIEGFQQSRGLHQQRPYLLPFGVALLILFVWLAVIDGVDGPILKELVGQPKQAVPRLRDG